MSATTAVVDDLDDELVVGQRSRDLTTRGVRVADDVGEGLLGHPVRRDLDGRGQSGWLVGQVEGDGQPRTVRQLPTELGDGPEQADVVDRRRA